MLEGEAEAIMRALVEGAIKGRSIPLTLCVDRLFPARHDRHIEIALPAIANLHDLLAAQGVVIQHAADGRLTPSEASSLAQLLELRRNSIETVELEARISALEGRQAAPQPHA
jgi:hypothetical protein